jgi:hypothetical protein
MRRVFPAVLTAVLAAGGCGYVGDPKPPLANIPVAIGDLAAVQRDARIIVQFTLPPRTTEGMPIRKPLKLDLRIGQAFAPFHADRWAEQAAEASEGPVENGRALYEIPVAKWSGELVVIGARAISANGKASDWSNFVRLRVVPPPQKPAELRPELVPTGVKLTWTAPGSRFRILRRGPGETGFIPVATVEAHEWTDTSTEYGKQYSYIVQTVVETGEGPEAESEPSAPVAITPKDIFPPAAPAGLRIAVAPDSLELTWDRNTEPDLAGYRVYRAPAGGQFEKIADIGQIPAYSDHNVEHGKTYRYEVAAVDAAGNESARSAPAEATIE